MIGKNILSTIKNELYNNLILCLSNLYAIIPNIKKIEYINEMITTTKKIYKSVFFLNKGIK